MFTNIDSSLYSTVYDEDKLNNQSCSLDDKWSQLDYEPVSKLDEPFDEYMSSLFEPSYRDSSSSETVSEDQNAVFGVCDALEDCVRFLNGAPSTYSSETLVESTDFDTSIPIVDQVSQTQRERSSSSDSDCELISLDINTPITDPLSSSVVQPQATSESFVQEFFNETSGIEKISPRGVYACETADISTLGSHHVQSLLSPADSANPSSTLVRKPPPLFLAPKQTSSSGGVTSGAKLIEESTKIIPDQPRTSALMSAPTSAPPSVPTINLSQPVMSQHINKIAIRCVDEVEGTWYADRPFPPFNLELFDVENGMLVEDATNWKVKIVVLDGYGTDATEQVTSDATDRLFVVSAGRVLIQGIRFSAVSSKCGGHFRFLASVVRQTHQTPSVRPFISQPFQVLSYRLYHAPKVSEDNLRPDDSVSKMKGIGSQYAKRMKCIGIGTISQLAAVNLNMDCDQRTKLLDALRKQRGSLTWVKFEKYVTSARQIMSKCSDSDSVECVALPHTTARRKIQLDTGASACIRPAKRQKVHEVDEAGCITTIPMFQAL